MGLNAGLDQARHHRIAGHQDTAILKFPQAIDVTPKTGATGNRDHRGIAEHAPAFTEGGGRKDGLGIGGGVEDAGETVHDVVAVHLGPVRQGLGDQGRDPPPGVLGGTRQGMAVDDVASGQSGQGFVAAEVLIAQSLGSGLVGNREHDRLQLLKDRQEGGLGGERGGKGFVFAGKQRDDDFTLFQQGVSRHPP